MPKNMIRITLLFMLILVSQRSVFAQSDNSAIVQAVLFYSPTCPHCHEVIENVLPPLKEQYGEQLQLIGIDTSKQTGSQLYEASVEAFAIPREKLGVPALIVGDVVLVGSAEIPGQFPGIIEQGLADGGISWPAIPNLAQEIPDLPPPARDIVQNEISTATSNTDTEEIMTDVLTDEATKTNEDPAGIAVAWAVLLGMLVALFFVVWRLFRSNLQTKHVASGLSSWVIPLLSLIGLTIALYLAYVEIMHVSAVCGPIGRCNVVQSSAFAQIMGIPVAVLGALFYLAIIGSWFLLRHISSRRYSTLANILLALTIAGTLFSIYLTALELFVIHAVCAWCLSSAIVSTALMLIVVTAVTKESTASPTGQSAAQLQ